MQSSVARKADEQDQTHQEDVTGIAIFLFDDIHPFLSHCWQHYHGKPFTNTIMVPQLWPTVTINGKPVATVGFVNTEMQTAFLGWLTAVPELAGERRTAVISLLCRLVNDYAKELGYKAIWFPTGHKGLVSRLTQLGYTVMDEGEAKNLIKKVE